MNRLHFRFVNLDLGLAGVRADHKRLQPPLVAAEDAIGIELAARGPSKPSPVHGPNSRPFLGPRLRMSRRIDQEARGTEIRQPVNRTARRVHPLRRPPGERAGSELARAKSEPGEVEESAGSCLASGSKGNGWLPMNLPVHERELAAKRHKGHKTKNLLLCPLCLFVAIPALGSHLDTVHGSCLVSRSKGNGWLPMNRRINQKARGAEIRQPVNRTARRAHPLRRPAGERAGSELARARSEPGEVEESAGSCLVSGSKKNGWLPMNLPSGARIAPLRATCATSPRCDQAVARMSADGLEFRTHEISHAC